MKTLAFKIHGLDCAEEVAALKREVAPLAGGEEALSFDILNGRMIVSTARPGVTPEAVAAAVARAGLRAEPWSRGAAAEGTDGRLRRRRTLLTAASAVFVLIGLLSKVFFLAAVAAGLWLVAPKAWLALRRLRPDMNLLMTLAVAGALGIGQWLEAATVAFLFALSLELESWSVGRARRAVAKLLELSPAVARLRHADGTEEIVGPEAVPVGHPFIVRPGERVPLDGVVRGGTSDVNEAPITGESRPVAKEAGSPVYAGTINGGGALEVECTKALHDSTLHHIIRMVEEAQTRRSRSERWVERFARLYTPLVFAAAFLVAAGPPLLLHAPFGGWLYRGLVLLVIGCPCALVISTPVTIVAALAAAAHHGVLVKGGEALEAPARLKAMAFDKTGTLTLGRPRVVEIVPLDGHSDRELLERAAALEARSSHPIAEAIAACAAERGLKVRAGRDHQVIPGKGATALFDETPYWIGSHRYLEERDQETPEVHERLEAMAEAGRTVIVVGNERHVCGFIAAADQVRPEAGPALAALKRLGIDHLVMLTGDNEGTARAIAAETGVLEVEADLLPADKVEIVGRLVEQHGAVAMVGDGVNDAPAMARATVGIAMGAAGSDAAIETADIALLSDDLSRLPWLVEHSRMARRIVVQNIAFALGVKALFVALTMFGLASLWGAIAADMGASLLVILNGLRMLQSAPE